MKNRDVAEGERVNLMDNGQLIIENEKNNG